MSTITPAETPRKSRKKNTPTRPDSAQPAEVTRSCFNCGSLATRLCGKCNVGICSSQECDELHASPGGLHQKRTTAQERGEGPRTRRRAAPPSAPPVPIQSPEAQLMTELLYIAGELARRAKARILATDGTDTNDDEATEAAVRWMLASLAVADAIRRPRPGRKPKTDRKQLPLFPGATDES